ncbi:phosphoribosylamine--glycine ligase [Anaerofustis stercorihominis]|uniref:Phosphoribosylamine--glycine ligase n=1 Tax=Anaerofustis stercorihominis DSM 17244 TaxID=445971 RepID=B1CAZ2_9FIRM|nr:phosphoribosylamine--glycine ligase [Anaerofustis stercorihominis]EDS71439.1 phosphoribosylamine--glycine ligase [Anaerofustis stercorihominis DSM 17244]MCQ4795391.1 phosphoribosylamine--glycine ligase [Anaerofustis stercorihominis]MCR2033039.1 phosphoribosylamine--glycine ligase [Anaerofustis stercorihominis]
MKVLVVGSGGREHALVYKLKQSPLVTEVFCAPGNAGIANIAECVDIKVDDIDSLKEFAKTNEIGLTVIGPELPLVMGIVDEFEKEGLKVFGPNKKCAAFEGSKGLTKRFLEKYKIPTAKYLEVTTYEEGVKNLENFGFPVVVKADGLAAGKGVIICENREMAVNALKDIMVDKVFGDSGNSVVIEEFLTGTELSTLCFVDGNKIIPMESARDYKPAYDNDEGLNTGGMGNYSPNKIFDDKLNAKVRTKILDPIIKGFKSEELDYKGVLFIGLMVENGEPKVLEFNVRFGDPETQVVMLRLESDLANIMLNTADGILEEDDIVWSDESSVCVVMVSGGYPESYENGKVISGLDKVSEDVIVFHAGTKREGEDIVTNGGRVLNICAVGETLDEAREKVYNEVNKISYDGAYFRNDIAR